MFSSGTIKRSFGVAVALAAAVTATHASAAVVTSVTGVPASDPTGIFDASQPGVNYSLSSGTAVLPNGFDLRDLFGGNFGTNGWESGSVIFADNNPLGTIQSIKVQLAAPVAIKYFSLFLQDDGTNGNRSASGFQLFAGNTLLDDVTILDSTGTQSYTSVYGNNYIEISDVLDNAPASDTYTLNFIQNQNGNGSSGIRAVEFAAAVPEPMGLPIIAISLIGMLRRGRRTKLAA